MTGFQMSRAGDEDSPVVACDYFGGVFEYIKHMLMEEDDLDHRPCMFQDCSALQAAEKYFYEALNDDPPASPGSRPKRSCHDSNNGVCAEERRSKQVASFGDEDTNINVDEMEKYDKTFLCPKMNQGFYNEQPPLLADSDETTDSEEESKKEYRKSREVKRGRPKGSKKNRKVSQVVDLSSLLTRSAQAVSIFDIKRAQDLLTQIRDHSSPLGDSHERLAHCFANALEARMTATGSALYTALTSRRTQASHLLKSYQAYVTVCPFKRMSNIFANKSIGRYTSKASKIHIVDFGILYGFQWPCIIQGLSLKPGGPPKLRITGIDYPQPGFKPAERVEQTGERLKEYCKRFNVQFEYKAIAKSRWEDIEVEDIEIERDEMLVVNCLYRLRHVPDELSPGMKMSPRDAVLNTIKKLKPDLFVHGVVNGSYNSQFFPTRFKEALYHFSSLFDMVEATLPREDEDRLMYEREVFGRDVMNVVACEGAERVERPESYKQWQVRNQRGGFRVMDLNEEIVSEVKMKVTSEYHKDFLVEEDGGWLLQGWKGRVMYALSCWKLTSSHLI